MKHVLSVFMLIASFATFSWADTNSSVPEENKEAIQLQIPAEADSTADTYPEMTSRRQFSRRIQSATVDLVSEILAKNPDISAEDKEAIAKALQHRPRSFGKDRDLGLGKTVVAVVAIALTFGGPIILVSLVLYANHRKRSLTRDIVNQFVTNGQPIPPEVWQGLSRERSPRSNLHKGLVTVGLGAGVFLSFWLMGSEKAIYLAFIPLFIGFAQLLIWTLEKNKVSSGG
jgi:hypothetical protein